MEGIVVIFLIAVSIWGARFLSDRLAQARAAKLAAAQPAAPAADATTLSSRLHELDAVFSNFASGSAHPRELAENAAFKQAVDLLAKPDVPLETVMQYVQGVNWTLCCAALAALQRRPDRAQVVDQVVSQFDKLAPWAMHFALAYFLDVQPRPPVGAAVAGAKDWWRESPIIPLLIQDYFARSDALGDAAVFGNSIYGTSAAAPATIRMFLERIDHPIARELAARLADIERTSIDRAFLTSFGRFWADHHKTQFLVEPDEFNAAFRVVDTALRQSPARSLLVSGERLVGKTAFLQLAALQLEYDGWSVFEAGGADLMAGQQWFGQLEGRIRQAVDQLTTEKKLIWYIPDLLALAQSGTHQGQSSSILDQILPSIVAGRLVVWTEATPTSVARLLQMRPALRGVFEVVRLESMDEEDTRTLALQVMEKMSASTGLTIEEDCAAAAVGSARQYLSAGNFPGAALQLIKLTLSRAADGSTEIGPHDVLETLSQLTGLPISILDGRERIDLASIRDFFGSRVIGQDEAVATVVERIAMLKAGLNDPDRPIGVFLFAGPTGTGKTELAKTVADYLFGSVERMIRLDMSEYQTPESISGILGSGGAGPGANEVGSLVTAVRKQPFSVVLLDEFEKAHPRIWDLFLQVFDDARLTDSLGQVADFRHCIIIMTTNLGATSHQTSGLGFAPSADVFTTEQVMRAISQTYRPEFQNRLDKIIVFRPLTRELMRVILKKELGEVLERRGLKDRDWAVEWESTALEFLLEKGFSPEMGARPLKRAIEQYVIAPLAATIVEKRAPEGDQFVFFRSDGRAIQAEFVDPDAPPAAAVPSAEPVGRPPALGSMILSPRGTRGECDALASEAASIEQALHARAWEDLKRQLSDEMSVPGFWDRPDRFEKLARLALMDRVAAAADTAEALRGRLTRGSDRTGAYSRELISRLALQLHLVREGIKDALDGAPIEVAIAVEPALSAASDGASTDAWCRELRGMYRNWCSNRHMQASEIHSGPPGSLPMLLVTGFGAHRVLARECGLHVLELPDSGNGSNRATARVKLAVAPLGDVPPAQLPSMMVRAFDKASPPSALVRRYRREPAPLVRSGDGSWRTGKLDSVLGGDFDLLAAEEAQRI